jgi:hypothetical protein
MLSRNLRRKTCSTRSRTRISRKYIAPREACETLQEFCLVTSSRSCIAGCLWTRTILGSFGPRACHRPAPRRDHEVRRPVETNYNATLVSFGT